MMDVGEWDQRVREHLWHDLEAEHRHLARVLDDVRSLAEEGSFETARRRFGEYRLAHERHLLAERKLEAFCAGVREVASFLVQLERERGRVLEQSERVWTGLCRERRAPLPRMLERLATLVTEHERAQRRLIPRRAPAEPRAPQCPGRVAAATRASLSPCPIPVGQAPVECSVWGPRCLRAPSGP